MIERIYILENVDPVIFYGVNNANMQLIKTLFPKLRIVARGNVMKVIGEEEESELFLKKIREIEKYCEEFNTLGEDTILDIVKGNAPVVARQENLIIHGMNGKPITARTENQQKLVKAFDENDLVFATGPAGSGKTFVAIALAVRALKNKEARKIILSRPAVEAGEKLGFLPGEMKDKLDPYLQPLYDALQDMIPAAKLKEYMENNVIQIAPLAFMYPRRGAEHDDAPDQDVPDPPGHEREDDRHGRRHTDRPAALHHLGPHPGDAGTERCQRYRPRAVRQEGHRTPQARAAHCRGLRPVRRPKPRGEKGAA